MATRLNPEQAALVASLFHDQNRYGKDTHTLLNFYASPTPPSCEVPNGGIKRPSDAELDSVRAWWASKTRYGDITKVVHVSGALGSSMPSSEDKGKPEDAGFAGKRSSRLGASYYVAYASTERATTGDDHEVPVPDDDLTTAARTTDYWSHTECVRGSKAHAETCAPFELRRAVLYDGLEVALELKAHPGRVFYRLPRSYKREYFPLLRALSGLGNRLTIDRNQWVLKSVLGEPPIRFQLFYGGSHFYELAAMDQDARVERSVFGTTLPTSLPQ